MGGREDRTCDGLNGSNEGKTGLKDASQVFGLSNWVPFTEMGTGIILHTCMKEKHDINV